MPDAFLQKDLLLKAGLLDLPHLLHEVLQFDLLLVEVVLQHQQAVLPGLDAALEVQDLVGEFVRRFNNAGQVGDAAFLVVVQEAHHLEVLSSQLRLL